MSIPAIAPSPIARLLLELEARKASGALAIGGRRIVLTEGAIVEVRPHAEDSSLGDFLVATGRLTEEELERAKREASSKRQPLEASLRSNDLVPVDVLLDTRRALWLDRFVRGLAVEESASVQPGLLVPEPNPSPGPAISTLSFVLDGLTRRAGYAGDAERIGRLAQAWFEWLETPQRGRASAWADLGEVPSPVLASTLFPRHPAAPSRIAALVRAGLARVTERRSNLPPPAPRNPSFAAPAPTDGPITARRALALQLLTSGAPDRDDRPLGIGRVASWLPAPSGALNDPLDALERRIAQLEQAGASGPERARAWLELSAGFRTHFEALDEAARAAREAVAADPTCHEALQLAATLCSAVARPDLAFAYEAGLAAALTDAASKAQALVRAADYARRADKPGTALRSLRQAAELRPDDPALAERYAHALMMRGDLEQALQVALRAAEQYRVQRPEVARALLAWAHEIAPFDPTVAGELASVLAAEGYGEAAVAHIARAARNTRDPEVSRRLWLAASVRADLVARPDLAADLLLEAVRRTPDDDGAFVTPSLNALASAGALLELAIVAEELSEHVHGEARAACLLRAALARLELPGDPSVPFELCVRALTADPQNKQALELLQQLDSARGPHAFADAVERVLRAPREQADITRGLLGRFVAFVASERLPTMERWAWSTWTQLTGLAPSAEQQRSLEQRLEQFEAHTQTLEQALRESTADGRTRAALKLADHLRHDPLQRAKARKLYEKVLERDPVNDHAAHGLEALLRLDHNLVALSGVLAQRAAKAPPGPQRVAAQLALIHHQWKRGELDSALRITTELLRDVPAHREGLVLLHRLSIAMRSSAMERDALSRRIEASVDPRERARLLCAAARSYSEDDDQAEATRRAEQALAADPRCAEAALILVEHHGTLDPARRVAALRAARVVLGESPQLLRLLAQACFGTRDGRGQLEALETLARLSPFDPFPALGLCALRATGRDPVALTAAVHTVVTPERRTDATSESARAALSRLWALGKRREAAELALTVADALGEQGDELVTWSLPYVRESDDPRLARAVLERMVARAKGDSRRAELRRLAHLCRAQGERAAEARVYLRLLAVEASDGEALDRLTHIYAESMELERLTAVLTLRTNLARDLDERRERLLSLALVSIDMMGDSAAAADLVRAALAPEKRGEAIIDAPLPELQRGIGLLLSSNAPRVAFDLLLELSEESSTGRARALLEEAIHVAEHDLHDAELALRAAMLGLEAHPFHSPFLLHFERLALQLSDVATGREVYRHLAEASVGNHGKRAVLYRASRFLERAGALPEALEMAEQAFLLHPSDGAVLATLARLAEGTGTPEALVRALLRLAADPSVGPRKAEHLARAANLCEQQLKDIQQAAAFYGQAFESSGAEEHGANATRTLLLLAQSDASLARRLSAKVHDRLTRQAKEARSGGERASALIGLAEMALDFYGQAEDATSYTQAAKQAIESEPDLERSRRERVEQRLQAALARLPVRRETRPPGTRVSDRPVRTSERPPFSSPVLTPKWSDPRRSQASYARPSTRETLRPSMHSVPPAHDDPRLPGVLPIVTPVITERRPLRVEARVGGLSAEEDSVLQGLCAAQPDALARLNELSGTTIEQNAKLCEALLERTRSGTLTMPALRGLWLLSERAHRRDVRAVSGEILSHVDPTCAAVRSTRLPAPHDDATKAALAEARDDGPLTPTFNALYNVFLGGGPLFKRPLSSYGVASSDFIPTRDDSAYASALRDVSLVLGTEHETYRKPSGRDLVNVVPTYPPSLIIGDGTTQAPMALRFRFGYAFECARPSSVLLTTLSKDAAITLLAAIRAAFGATSTHSATVDREAAGLAAELWRTLPSAGQKQIAGSLQHMTEAPSYDALIDALRLRAARVGLVTAGAVDVALANLDLDVPSGQRVPGSEAGLAAALVERPLLAKLLSFALSDAYLALRSRESS